MFYFGAKRDNSRNIPSEECSRTRLFREGEELQLSDSNSHEYSQDTCTRVEFFALFLIIRFPYTSLVIILLFSIFAGLRKAKTRRKRLFWFEIRWRERNTVLAEFEKFYVIAAHWETTVSTAFLGKIFRQTTRTSARNYTVSWNLVKIWCIFCIGYLSNKPCWNKYSYLGWCLSCNYFIGKICILSFSSVYRYNWSMIFFHFQTPVLSYFKELYKRRKVRFVFRSNENYCPIMRFGCSYREWRFQPGAGGKIFIVYSHFCL